MTQAALLPSLDDRLDEAFNDLKPTAEGALQEVALREKKVSKSYYRKRFWRLIGLKNRDLKFTRTKYDEIAGRYWEDEAKASEENRILAQVGTEPRFVSQLAFLKYRRTYLAKFIAQSGARSILEVGAGELTTLLAIVDLLGEQVESITALDLSAKRLEVGRQHDTLGRIDHLISGSASHLPFADNAFDLIFTHHCLEQAPSLVTPALREFARVARQQIILAEPAYGLAPPLQRKRIRKVGYARGISTAAKRLGLRVTDHHLMPVGLHLNGTALTIIDVTS